jgi:simple sugar transport system substrate-binding protein
MRRTISLLLLVVTLLLAACQQQATEPAAGEGEEQTTPDAAATEEPAEPADADRAASGEAPAPFSEGEVRVALVKQSGAGDYFEQWGDGAEAQAEAIGIALDVYDAQAQNEKMVTDMETALNSGVDGIIVDHGLADTMNPMIDRAIEQGVPVVVYDLEVTNPEAVNTLQSDQEIARMVLEHMAAEIEDGSKVGYVNVLGIAPLDRRHEVWEEMRDAHSWEEAFFVGKFTNAVATDNCGLVDSALRANQDVTAIFAPYDELTKGAVCGVENNNLTDKIRIWGVDISTADIEVMTKEGSPWRATAATDPAAVGAAVVRTMALEIAGQLGAKEVVFPATLITQEFLRENDVRNMDDLRAKLEELNLSQVSSADWIPEP